MRIFNRILALQLLAIVLFGCGGSLQMNSFWRDREITIDGVLNEWQSGTSFIENENVVVGFFNDDENLYVSLTSSDRILQRQFMMMGFTLWLDAQGGKSRDFGVKFPVGLMEMGREMRGQMGNEGFSDMRSRFEESLADLEIIMRKKGGVHRMQVAEAKGIEVKVAGFPQNLVYEIKIPLAISEAHPFAISAQTGQLIGVGFETAKLDRQAMQDRMGGGFRGGRPGGFGGGRGGGFGSAGGPQQMMQQFQMWLSVKLGTENDRVSAGMMQDENAYTPTPVDPLPDPVDRPRLRDRYDGAPKVGELAPVFTLKSLDGNSETSLESFRDEKPVVLFFGSYT